MFDYQSLGKRIFISCRLEFQYTNNTVQYEALVQDLKKCIYLCFKNLKVFGDSEIIVRQVSDIVHYNSPHLKGYQSKVLNMINNYFAFNITTIPRSQNRETNSLATATSRLAPLEDYQKSIFLVEILYRPSIPKNVTN